MFSTSTRPRRKYDVPNWLLFVSRFSSYGIFKQLRSVSPGWVTLALSFAVGVVFCSASLAGAQTCDDGQYSTQTQGQYILQNDEWGLAGDTGGWQEICNGSATSNSWSATWFWSPGTGTIKAYPSIYSGWNYGTWSPGGGFPVEISAQSPLPTSVSFDMTGDNEYDTAYDLFFSPDGNPSAPSAEMMVWLSYAGHNPAGTKVASAITLGGISGTWDVWKGTGGGSWPLWTFVRDSQVSSFSGNLQPFVYYLAYTTAWLNSSWYELNIEFGTEIIQSNDANGSITVSSFSAAAK